MLIKFAYYAQYYLCNHYRLFIRVYSSVHNKPLGIVTVLLEYIDLLVFPTDRLVVRELLNYLPLPAVIKVGGLAPVAPTSLYTHAYLTITTIRDKGNLTKVSYVLCHAYIQFSIHTFNR